MSDQDKSIEGDEQDKNNTPRGRVITFDDLLRVVSDRKRMFDKDGYPFGLGRQRGFTAEPLYELSSGPRNLLSTREGYVQLDGRYLPIWPTPQDRVAINNSSVPIKLETTKTPVEHTYTIVGFFNQAGGENIVDSISAINSTIAAQSWKQQRGGHADLTVLLVLVGDHTSLLVSIGDPDPKNVVTATPGKDGATYPPFSIVGFMCSDDDGCFVDVWYTAPDMLVAAAMTKEERGDDFEICAVFAMDIHPFVVYRGDPS